MQQVNSNKLGFSIEDKVIRFTSDKAINRSWTLPIKDIAVIAVANKMRAEDSLIVLFVDKQKRIFDVDISYKLEETASFDWFWQQISARFDIQGDIYRKFFPNKTLVIYPKHLDGQRLFEPLTLSSLVPIVINGMKRLFQWEKGVLHQEVLDYIDQLKSNQA